LNMFSAYRVGNAVCVANSGNGALRRPHFPQFLSCLRLARGVKCICNRQRLTRGPCNIGSSPEIQDGLERVVFGAPTIAVPSEFGMTRTWRRRSCTALHVSRPSQSRKNIIAAACFRRGPFYQLSRRDRRRAHLAKSAIFIIVASMPRLSRGKLSNIEWS
jgi:hypothetical protein